MNPGTEEEVGINLIHGLVQTEAFGRFPSEGTLSRERSLLRGVRRGLGEEGKGQRKQV